MTTSGPPLRRPRNRRAQLALVAAELFCARGYYGVGVDEIAAAAGISGPAVYRHFPTKYAILVQATRDLVGALHTTVDEALDPLDPPEFQLDRTLHALARLAVERRKVSGLYQWEGRYLTREHRAEFGADLAAVTRRLGAVLRGLRPELAEPDSELLVRAALSAIGSLGTHRAAIGKGRAEQLLGYLGWALLHADLPVMSQEVASQKPLPGNENVAPNGHLALAARREVLLAAAIRLFHHRGYHAVAIEDIGAAAGITASSVYRHFASKAELLAAAYYRATDRLAAVTSAALTAAATPDEALGRLADAYVRLTFEQHELVSVYLAENSNLPERDRHQLRKAQRLHTEEWVRLVTAVRGELSAADARIVVHAALNVVIDLGRVVGFDLDHGGLERVCRLVRTALYQA